MKTRWSLDEIIAAHLNCEIDEVEFAYLVDLHEAVREAASDPGPTIH